MQDAHNPPSPYSSSGPSLGGVAKNGSKTGPRSFAEIASEREKHRQVVWREIQAIAAEYHALLPRDMATKIGAAYARYSSRHQDSIADQIRTIFRDAVRQSVYIPLENIYFDLATRGVKNDRVGLNGLREVLARKAVTIVFFFATNRLFRSVYRALQFVAEEIKERGIHAVFVKSGVDTRDANRWSQMLMFNAQMDEFQSKANVDNIRAAHEGLLEKRLQYGTLSLGYWGEPIPGEMTRRGKPRKRISIEPITAAFVVTIFLWFVEHRLTLAEIARRLNADPDAPCPPKSPHRHWTPKVVGSVLRNARYRGWWKYGETENTWIPSKDYSRPIPRAVPLLEIQFEELRIVSDEVWYRAQSLLVTEPTRSAGRKPRGGPLADRPRLLGSLFHCPEHQHPLYVGGGYGKYIFCPRCRDVHDHERPLFTLLSRKLALKKTCETLAQLIRADDGLVQKVISAFQKHAAELQAKPTGDLDKLLAQRDRIDKRIKFVLRNPGDTDDEEKESELELRSLRAERAGVDAEIAQAKSSAARTVLVPTPEEVDQKLEEMVGILRSAIVQGDGADAGRARRIIDLLTGGRIDLHQMGERTQKAGWLQGRFRLNLMAAIPDLQPPADCSEDAPLITIDYLEDEGPDPDLVRQAMELHDHNALNCEIRKALGIGELQLKTLLRTGFADRGEVMPDANQRRIDLMKISNPPKHVRIADEVKKLAEEGEGLTLLEVASRLGVKRDVVQKAWKHWHESRGLNPPDGRTRRKTLPRKSSTSKDQQHGDTPREEGDDESD